MTRWALAGSVKGTKSRKHLPSFPVRINPLRTDDVVPEGFADLDDVLSELIDREDADRLRARRRELAEEISPAGLKMLRLQAGMSQAELAQLVGTSQPRLSAWENRPETISLESVRGLARALRVDYNTFFSAVFND